MTILYVFLLVFLLNICCWNKWKKSPLHRHVKNLLIFLSFQKLKFQIKVMKSSTKYMEITILRCTLIIWRILDCSSGITRKYNIATFWFFSKCWQNCRAYFTLNPLFKKLIKPPTLLSWFFRLVLRSFFSIQDKILRIIFLHAINLAKLAAYIINFHCILSNSRYSTFK